MYVTLDHTEDIATNIKTFWFRPERPVQYIAGQYIEMTLPHDGMDDRGQKRFFTLSSSPSEEFLSITTKHAVDRVSTFKQTLFGLALGTKIHLAEPMGDFVLPKDQTLPLVFVVGGIGVTPVRSMVKWLSDTHERRQIRIIYSAHSLDEVAFRELFEDYGAKLDVILSEQTADWSGRTGQLSSELILELASDHQDQLIYISGPEPMVEKLEDQLKAAAFPQDKLVLDFFPGYPPL